MTDARLRSERPLHERQRRQVGPPARLAWAMGWVSLLVVLVLARGQAVAAEAAGPAPLRLGLVNFVGEATNFWALHEGYFAHEGLAVDARINASGWESLQQLQGGRLDLATAEPTPVVFAALNRTGLPVNFAVVASILEGTSLNHLVVAKGRGIEDLQDLEGRRIGLPRGTSSEYFWDTIALDYGIDTGAVTIVDLPVPELAAAFAAGRIDAAVAWTPYAERIVRAVNNQARILNAENIYTTSWLVIARTVFLRRHRARIEAYLNALYRAQEDIVRMPMAVAEVHAARAGVEPGLLRQAYRTIDFDLGLNEALLLNFAQQAQWAIEAGIASGPAPAFRQFLAPGPLEAVRPGSVHLFD